MKKLKMQNSKLKIKLTNHQLAKRGFSLIELLVVLAIMGFFVAMMTQVFTKGDDQRRFDETRIRMEEIKKAILGSEGAYANGQRQFAGYVADMGGLVILTASSVDGDGAAGAGHQYRCIRGHVAAANNRPESGVPAIWRTYWVQDDDQPGGSWIEGAEYMNIAASSVNGVGVGAGHEYVCIRTHIATADTCPETGIHWDSYWIRCDGEVGGAWIAGTEYISCEKTLWDGSYYVDGVGAGAGQQYRCIRAHTAEDGTNPGATSNQPEVAGANWADYWVHDVFQPAGNLWIVDTAYVSPWRYRASSVDGDAAAPPGSKYRCIKSHTAIAGVAGNCPIGGANWADCWVQDNSCPGSTWAGGTVYIDSKIWVGWRGPYIETPPRDILTDGWGNPFVFIPHINATETPDTQPGEIKIISYGADSIKDVGGETGYDIDIEMIIKRTEYTAPIAGRVKGYAPGNEVNVRVRIHFPLNGNDEQQTIQRIPGPPVLEGVLADGYFRFDISMAAPGVGEEVLDTPLGLCSIMAWEESLPAANPEQDNPDGAELKKNLVITVEPTGNWLGDIEIQ